MATKAAAKKASAGTTVLEFDVDKIKAREKEVARETDAQIIERLRERFEILDEMTGAVRSGDVRAWPHSRSDRSVRGGRLSFRSAGHGQEPRGQGATDPVASEGC